jgi:outer membrane protein assembly factor BamB
VQQFYSDSPPILVGWGIMGMVSYKWLCIVLIGALLATSLTVSQVSVGVDWKATCDAPVVGSPLVVNDLIYVMSQYGGSANTIQCINEQNGATQWTFKGDYCHFTVAEDRLFVFDSEGFYCLNASSGSLFWMQNGQILDATISGDTVYACGDYSSDSQPSRNSFNGAIAVFNASTGERTRTISEANMTLGYFVLTKGTVVAAAQQSTSFNVALNPGVFAFNASTGGKIWNYSTRGFVNALMLNGGDVYADVRQGFPDTPTSDSLVALRAQDGSPLWSFSVPDLIDSLTFTKDTAYLITNKQQESPSGEQVLTNPGSTVYAINCINGDLKWSYKADETSLSSGLAVNSRLYVTCEQSLICFNGENGAVIWKFIDGEAANSSSALNTLYSDGVIYAEAAGSTSSNLYALDAWSGTVLWSVPIESASLSPPAIYGGKVYVCGYNAAETLEGTVFTVNPTVARLPQTAIAIVVIAALAGALFFYSKKSRKDDMTVQRSGSL